MLHLNTHFNFAAKFPKLEEIYFQRQILYIWNEISDKLKLKGAMQRRHCW